MIYRQLCQWYIEPLGKQCFCSFKHHCSRVFHDGKDMIFWWCEWCWRMGWYANYNGSWAL